jgi:serine/threonine protein kinase
MSVPTTCAAFLECLRKSGLVDNQRLDEYLRQQPVGAATESVRSLALLLVRDGLLTAFQAERLRHGKSRNFFIQGKYKVLERLGSGGNATVFLCEHLTMCRPVALKVLPAKLAASPGGLERFLREARIAAQLKHPNLVSAYDVDQSAGMHFLVMEYIDGTNLHHLVKSFGPLPFVRAAHYIRQASEGLQYAHECRLVHRDIKPSNILLERSGTIKVLDMGLARFFHDDDDLTKKHHPGAVLGTPDFLSPEQALDSHSADVRSDIYSLGITFYFLLTGVTPFEQGTTAQKLLWHQVRQPRPIRSLRPDVPEEMAAVLEKMTAKSADQRYQVPAEVGAALAPWTSMGLVRPRDEEMPQHPPVLRNLCRQQPVMERSFLADLPATLAEVAPAANVLNPAARLPDQGCETGPTAPLDTSVALSGDRSTIIQSPPPPAVDPEPAQQPAPAPPRPSRGARRVAVAVIAATALVAASVVFLAVLLSTPTATPGETTSLQAGLPPATSNKVGPSTPSAPAVIFSRDGGNYRVRAPGYEAVVEADGCMTSLRIGGVELFLKGIDFSPPAPPEARISRGSYFYDEGGRAGVLKLGDLRQTEDSIVARSDLAAIEHHFTASGVTWKLDNLTDHEVRYYIVFHPNVRAVSNDRGEWSPLPVARPWGQTSWFAGNARLTLTGSDRIWGPWAGSYQVWQVTLSPRATRRVTAVAGNASAAELARIKALLGPASPPPPPR